MRAIYNRISFLFHRIILLIFLKDLIVPFELVEIGPFVKIVAQAICRANFGFNRIN